ncbi:hypothetical protein L2E82_14064 [Cichorium intybus]|uniref:Uncharacterized protein n=1 Tax=Cichorium intybus TaxID=13427 RepID=A0ACB9EYE4_CICIN|nr:hypothetical protein L2E82_14064 [Cichorium intybus]
MHLSWIMIPLEMRDGTFYDVKVREGTEWSREAQDGAALASTETPSRYDVLDDGKRVLDVVDQAVSGLVGVVMLNCERVDIATIVNASGVVVSDQGLPAIVARNTIMDSKSDSVFLPLVGRKVQTSDAAMNASSFEGADFLIYNNNGEENG